MVIYFSNALKSELRKDFNLSILCYKNSCSRFKDDIKKMLGSTITSSKEFKYIFGEQ